MTEQGPKETLVVVGEGVSEEAWESRFQKAAAAEQRQALLEVRSVLHQESASLSRWLTASLLAINSGAVIAALNSEQLSAGGKLWAGGFFTVGILLALMVAYSNLKLSHQFMPEVQKQLGYWISVNLNGERDAEMEAELDREWSRASKYRLLPDIIGWTSLIFFVVGLVTIGTDLNSEGIDEVRVEGKRSDVRR